jgi:hypothetical protein
MIQKNFGRKNYFEEFEKFSEKSLVNNLLSHVAAGRVGGAGPPSCKTWPQAAALGTNRGGSWLPFLGQIASNYVHGWQHWGTTRRVLATFPRPDSFQLCPRVAALHHHTMF